MPRKPTNRDSRVLLYHQIKAYKEGYSQHMMVKVLEMAQSMIGRIVKRYG